MWTTSVTEEEEEEECHRWSGGLPVVVSLQAALDAGGSRQETCRKCSACRLPAVSRDQLSCSVGPCSSRVLPLAELSDLSDRLKGTLWKTSAEILNEAQARPFQALLCFCCATGMQAPAMEVSSSGTRALPRQPPACTLRRQRVPKIQMSACQRAAQAACRPVGLSVQPQRWGFQVDRSRGGLYSTLLADC